MHRSLATLVLFLGCATPEPGLVDVAIETTDPGAVAPWSGPARPTVDVDWVQREPRREWGGPIVEDFPGEARLTEEVAWVALIAPGGERHPVAQVPSFPDDLRLFRADGGWLEPAGAWTLQGEIRSGVPEDLVGAQVLAPFQVVDPRPGGAVDVPDGFDRVFVVVEGTWRTPGSSSNAIVSSLVMDLLLFRVRRAAEDLEIVAYVSPSGDGPICRADTALATLDDSGYGESLRPEVVVSGDVPLRIYDVRYAFGLDGALTPQGVVLQALADADDLAPAFDDPDDPGGGAEPCGILHCEPCPHDVERQCAPLTMADYALEPAVGFEDPTALDDAPPCAGPSAGSLAICSALGPVTVGGWLLGVALLLVRRRKG